MMKKISVLCIFGILVCSALVVSSEYPILHKQVDIRQAHLAWLCAIQEVRMTAAITYIDEISAGKGIAGLQSLLDEFQEETALLQTLTTHVSLNNALQQFQQITSNFRTELRSQQTTYNGRLLVLQERIQTGLQTNATHLTNLENTYWETREINELWIFDYRVDRAQDILTSLANHGYNTTMAQERLNEINGKRQDLEAAYTSRNETQIHSMNVQLYQLSLELRDIVRDLQVQIPVEKRVHYWIHVGERAVNRTATIIVELSTLGFNVSALQSLHLQAEADLGLAQDAFLSGNITHAIDALHDLKANFIALRDAYHELILQGIITDDTKRVVEQTQIALNDTIDGIENIS